VKELVERNGLERPAIEGESPVHEHWSPRAAFPEYHPAREIGWEGRRTIS
jgi:hypothetical protein